MQQLSIQGTFSQAGTGTVISSKDAAPALMVASEELTLPTPDIRCPSEAEAVVAAGSLSS